MEKTNVMRILDQKKISYEPLSYETETAMSAVEVAERLGIPVDLVYKTLVTVGKTGQHYVFVIPGAKELDLKKAAAAVREKNIEIVKSKDLLPLTGYIHGGCSPIGMKKFFPTTVDRSAEVLEQFYFSAGKIGFQVRLAPKDLAKVIRFSFADLCTEE